MDTSQATYIGNGDLPNTGVMCDIANTAAAANMFDLGDDSDDPIDSDCTESTEGRIHLHTPYRHTIRTIHTMDNDYSGVRIESPRVDTTWDGYDAAKARDVQVPDSNPNFYTHTPVGLVATEGETFTYYTLQLDTQPRKVQRQTGTHPNRAIRFTTDSTCGDQGDDSDGYGGPLVGDFFNDWTDATRPYDCGSVEVETNYWVDVTASATIHIDLATPASCPAAADTPWYAPSAYVPTAYAEGRPTVILKLALTH
eukprot:SAG11_NODE_233_length_11903_cov_4.983650_5_plen_254_part_00